MPIDPRIPQCEHIKVNGLRCGSPSLKGRKFCYFHYEVTRPLIRTDIPVLEDAGSVQYSLNRIAEYILEKRIDYKQASLLLWLMQIASSNARNARLEPLLKEDIIREHPEVSYVRTADSVIAVSQDDLEALASDATPQEASASSASSAVNHLVSDGVRKQPTREELDERTARAIERFRTTPPVQEVMPAQKGRRK